MEVFAPIYSKDVGFYTDFYHKGSPLLCDASLSTCSFLLAFYLFLSLRTARYLFPSPLMFVPFLMPTCERYLWIFTHLHL